MGHHHDNEHVVIGSLEALLTLKLNNPLRLVVEGKDRYTIPRISQLPHKMSNSVLGARQLLATHTPPPPPTQQTIQ